MRVFCDFDGTISTVDSTDHVLNRLADPAWETLEADWVAGRLDAAACMRGQVALIGGSDRDLDRVLDEVEIDPGFAVFANWCRRSDVPLTIVSDGVDRFIARILARHGLGDLPVVTNRFVGVAGRRGLEQPFKRRGCAAGTGVCKCHATAVEASERSRRLVFVGDGRSDFCVSGKADILFAKGALATYAAARGQPHHLYETFHDVAVGLGALLADRAAS